MTVTVAAMWGTTWDEAFSQKLPLPAAEDR
jgi:hypothetical protein